MLVDATLTVAVRDGNRGWVSADGVGTGVDATPGRRVELVSLDDGTAVAAIDCDAWAVTDESLLRTACLAVRVGAENLRLSADLVAPMQELRESRARIVETRYQGTPTGGA